MNNKVHSVIQYCNNIKKILHNNIYILLGFYGVLAIVFLCLSTKSIFHTELSSLFKINLPPAWQDNGDINHILGTDETGRDIFSYLLIAYKTTLLMTIKSVFCVVIISALINYILFFSQSVQAIITIVFRLIISVPPLLLVILISLLLKNNVTYILLVIGITYMPKFVHNIHEQIMLEWKKTYITAARLDGLSTSRILNFYIIPNVSSIYLTEIVALFSHILLTLTIVNFLGFGNKENYPDLGVMMSQMIDIIQTNYWAFLAPGIAIILTILLVNFLVFGINLILAKSGTN